MMRNWTLVVALAALIGAGTFGAPADGSSYHPPSTPGEEAVSTQQVFPLEAKESDLLPLTAGSSGTRHLLTRRDSSPAEFFAERSPFPRCGVNDTIVTHVCQSQPINCSDLELYHAAFEGDVSTVQRMLPDGVNVTICGRTPLILAILGIQPDTVRAILNFEEIGNAQTRGVDSEGATPLHHAAWTGQLDIARLLVAAGANVSAANVYGETPLHKAAKYNRREVARFLLQNGADVNARTTSEFYLGGVTPLQIAALYDYAGVTEDLLSAGADVETKTTALEFAVWGGSNTIVRLLLGHGANVNATLVGGRTVLHIAAFAGSSEVVRTLLEAGADAGATDDEGRTPLSYATTDDVRRALQQPGQR